MARLCERPGCSAVADVAYGFDAEQLVVWLDGFHAAQGARSGVLCRRHADAMVVPLGWMLDDRREPVPRLFRSEATQRPAPRARRAAADRDTTIEQLRLDAAVLEAIPDDDLDDTRTGRATPPATTEEVATPATPAATGGSGDSDGIGDPDGAAAADPDDDSSAPAPPWQPHFDESDDLHGLLNARGRLLSRAFNGISTD